MQIIIVTGQAGFSGSDFYDPYAEHYSDQASIDTDKPIYLNRFLCLQAAFKGLILGKSEFFYSLKVDSMSQ